MTSTARIRKWWTEEEDRILRQEAEFQLSQGSLNDWTRIAAKLPGRTNKDCRKRWSKIPGHIRKGVWCKAEDQRLKSAVNKLGYRWTHVADIVGTRNADQCAKRWHHSVDPSLDHSEWTPEDDARLVRAVASHGRVWTTIGEIEFPRRSATELKNRFVFIERRQQHLVESPRSTSKATPCAGSSPLNAEVKVEDFESANSLSDDDGSDIRLNLTPHDTSSCISFDSPFPLHNAIATTTPGAYFHSNDGIPDIMSQDLVFPEIDSIPGMELFHDGNQSLSSAASPCFGTDCFMTPPDDQMLELDHPWNLADVTPRSSPDELVLPGVEDGQQECGSTMILEDVSPQTITKIINVLYEAKAVVKVKILSGE